MKSQFLGLFLILIVVNSSICTDVMKNLRSKSKKQSQSNKTHINQIHDKGYEHILYNPTIFGVKKNFNIKFTSPEEVMKHDKELEEFHHQGNSVSESVLDPTKRDKVIQIGIPSGKRSIETYTYHNKENFSRKNDDDKPLVDVENVVKDTKRIEDKANELKSK